MKKLVYFITVVLILIVYSGCDKDFLDIDPEVGATEEQITNSFDGALTVLNGAYTDINHQAGVTRFPTSVRSYIMSMNNDVVIKGTGAVTTRRDGYTFQISRDFDGIFGSKSIYDLFYKVIGISNVLIKRAENIPNATEKQKNYILGQAYALRAWSYFYLVRLYNKTWDGHQTDKSVPLILSIDYTNLFPTRSTVGEVYNQIKSDLDSAVVALGNTIDRMNKSHIDLKTAKGIYANVALHMQEYVTAARLANEAKAGISLMDSSAYMSGFKNIDNPEWMWGFNQSNHDVNQTVISHLDFTIPNHSSARNNVYYTISKSLWDQMADGDVRKNTFDIDASNAPNYTFNTIAFGQLKFRALGRDSTHNLMMRAAEMYLIEAEALANIPRLEAAKDVLEELVQARYPGYQRSNANNTLALTNEILLERRKEFFIELGQVYFDIKRHKKGINRISATISTPYEHDPQVARVLTLPTESDDLDFKIPASELSQYR